MSREPCPGTVTATCAGASAAKSFSLAARQACTSAPHCPAPSFTPSSASARRASAMSMLSPPRSR